MSARGDGPLTPREALHSLGCVWTWRRAEHVARGQVLDVCALRGPLGAQRQVASVGAVCAAGESPAASVDAALLALLDAVLARAEVVARDAATAAARAAREAVEAEEFAARVRAASGRVRR